MADLDLHDDCWTTPEWGAPEPGDLYQGVALPSLEEGFGLYVLEQEPGVDVFVPVRFGYALVVRCFAAFVSLVPVALDGPTGFDFLLEQGRTAKDFVRLPPLLTHWDDGALALLYQPHTLPVSMLSDERDQPAERLATLDAPARATLNQRITRAWS